MTLAMIISAIKALPMLVETINSVWGWLTKISHGRPEMLLAEINSIMKDIKDNDTPESRQKAAHRISDIWAGLPVDSKKD
jgi:hypothetical protein